MEKFSVRCSGCKEELEYEVHSVYPGTNDMVIVPKVCLKCYSLKDDVHEEIKEACDKQESDTTMDTIRELLNQASVMDDGVLDTLKDIINSHEDLEPFLYVLDKER